MEITNILSIKDNWMLMKFRYKHKNKLVTIFVLGAVGLFFMFLAMILINNKSFHTKKRYFTIIDVAFGLQKSPPVMFKGLEIGRVENYSLTDQNKIHTNLFVYEEFRNRVIKFSVIQVNTNPLSGDITNLELMNPKDITSGDIIPEKSIIPHIKSEIGQKYVKDGIIALPEEGFGGVAQKVNTILESVVQNQTANKADATVKNLNLVLASLNEVLLGVEKTVAGQLAPEGIVGRVGGQSLRRSLGSLERTMNYIEDMVKVMHKSRKDIAPLLLNTNKTIKELNNTLKGVNNNPLIKGGITKDKKYLGVEIND